ncbi:hypothetical protein CABS01_12422 [Colletotrichum abscissum]|uniref:Uncharacterized protein n=2 Tax=Colletotrichum acutatum species complex TaxID=2707335 RepID=A0AAJ0E3N2_9PEZI|nr:hypothetical protein CABS01_12422 [Colletotrichum abscissum]KAK1508591.1 hypothetical protein CTAM01_02377 [Colletotrichum tamarilloi]KAK1534185.1 hypothetical protein CCOS01_02937 [Colletotrichum costaricense]
MHRAIANCKCKSAYVRGATFFFLSIP